MIAIRCPICDRVMQTQEPSQAPADWPDWPFCSARCRQIDLGRWLGEHYRVVEAPPHGAPAHDGPAEHAGPEDPGGSPKPAVPSAVRDRDEA